MPLYRRLTSTIFLLTVLLAISSCGMAETDSARQPTAAAYPIAQASPPSPQPTGAAYPIAQATTAPPLTQQTAYPAPVQEAHVEPPFNPGEATKEAALVFGHQTAQARFPHVTPLPRDQMPPLPTPATITPGPIPTISSRLATPLAGGRGFLFEKPLMGSSLFSTENSWVYTTYDRTYVVTAGDVGQPDGTHPDPKQGFVSLDITMPDKRVGWPSRHIGGGWYPTPSRDGPARIVDVQIDGDVWRLTIKTDHTTYIFDVLKGTLTPQP